VDDLDELRILVEQAKTGDPTAWETLFWRAYPRLFAYATRRLGPEDAKDAVSETFARAVRRIHTFCWSGGGFDAWLYGIVRHIVIDAQRVAYRRPSSDELGDWASDSPGPLDHLLGTEEAAAVRRAFLRLNPADQELIELRVVGRLSAEDTARVVGKRPGAVRMAQSRALERLRGLLDEAMVDYDD
jgi:RNA polymerase sigma-70 factor, ECF subfamily